MRSLISILFVILLSSISVHADTPTTPAINTLVESESIKLKEELNLEGLEHSIKVEGEDKWLNYYIYRDPFYRAKIIYGNPQEIENIPKYSEVTKRNEYRYLGRNKDGNPVTNPFYPNDIINGLHPRDWNVTNGCYVDKVKAFRSWDNLNSISNVIYEYNREAALEGNGLKYSDNWNSRDFDGGNDSNIKVELLTVAGLYTSGTVKIEHTDWGVKYGTFNIKTIPNERNEKFKVNGAVVTEITIDDDISTEEFPGHNGYSSNLDGAKDEVELELDISSVLTSTEPLYNPGVIEKYNLKLTSYSVNDGAVKSIGATSSHNGNSGSDLNYTLKINRNDLIDGINHITLKWESELKTIVENPMIRHYESKIAINVEESNKPPKATIQAPTQVYIGDTINIKGIGEDQETQPEKLTYKWSGDIPGLSEDYGAGIGGSHTFDSEGVYSITFSVMDENMSSDTVSKEIIVKQRDRALISLEGSIDPKSVTYTDNKPNVSLTIDSEGIILDKKGKSTKQVELRVKQLPKDYQIGDSINSVTEQFEALTEDSIKKVFTFDVNTAGEEYTQYFYVEFTAEFMDGTIEKETKLLSSKLSKKETVRPLVSVYASPNPVKAGQTTYVSGSANDPDGNIVNEFVGVTGNGEFVAEMSTMTFKKGWFTWDKDKDSNKTQKEYEIFYVGIDDDGVADAAKDTIIVLPPTVDADFKIGGTLKENRKITLDATISDVPEHYAPIIIDWEITAFDENADIDSIKFNGSLDGNLKKDILIKKSGKYQVRLFIENAAGFSDEIFKIIEVKPDLPPKADLTLPEKMLSDPEDDNYSTVPATDMSSSPDGDEIVRRVWFFCFDSDNDKDYLDETWFVHTDGDWKRVSDFGINSFDELENIDLDRLTYDNDLSVTMRVQPVGWYYVGLWVFEEFGQPTIEEFITETDKRNDNNFDD